MPFHATFRGQPSGTASLTKLPNGTYLIRPPSRDFRAIIGRKHGTLCYSGTANLGPVTLTTPLVAGDKPILRDRT